MESKDKDGIMEVELPVEFAMRFLVGMMRVSRVKVERSIERSMRVQLIYESVA